MGINYDNGTLKCDGCGKKIIPPNAEVEKWSIGDRIYCSEHCREVGEARANIQNQLDDEEAMLADRVNDDMNLLKGKPANVSVEDWLKFRKGQRDINNAYKNKIKNTTSKVTSFHKKILKIWLIAMVVVTLLIIIF